MDFANGAITCFGGLGNDTVFASEFADSLQGNEGNDTLRGDAGTDSISGGSGSDLFRYTTTAEDGDNATGGGPVEFITDVNFDQDRFQTPAAIVFAANMGAGNGANLAQSANIALNASAALSGDTANLTAAQFTFVGRTYLAINQADAGFQDDTDLLLDITGATGTIATSNFI
jgi:Ca2+-binding RTX toxin-like protein